MIVYHGGIDIVEQPDVKHSVRSLDFGRGFYVTKVREQAENWARRKVDILGRGNPVLNIYEMSDDWSKYRIKTFPDDLNEWIDFVCDCRDGSTEYLNYDLIYGKVADDKVFRVVDMYHSGVWDKERALKEIRVYPSYDQIAIITQEAVDELLIFDSFMEV